MTLATAISLHRTKAYSESHKITTKTSTSLQRKILFSCFPHYHDVYRVNARASISPGSVEITAGQMQALTDKTKCLLLESRK